MIPVVVHHVLCQVEFLSALHVACTCRRVGHGGAGAHRAGAKVPSLVLLRSCDPIGPDAYAELSPSSRTTARWGTNALAEGLTRRSAWSRYSRRC